MTTFILIYCNCPDENSAQAIASKLIQAKIAACVSLIPAVQSYYW
jgi:periplasmic divalent cation tolerance protein